MSAEDVHPAEPLAGPEGGTEEKVELSVDWAARTIPFSLPSARVLHCRRTLFADKVWRPVRPRPGRRDFPRCGWPPVMSGSLYTRANCWKLAAEADHGFDRLLFADALGSANADHRRPRSPK